MRDEIRPRFLYWYPVFDRLDEWKKLHASPRRHWTIRAFGGGVACELTWVYPNLSIGGLQKVAPTPEEAVWLALDAFPEILR